MKVKLNHTITLRRGSSLNFFADIDGQHIPKLYISRTAPVDDSGIIDGELYNNLPVKDIEKLMNDINKLVKEFNNI